MNNIVEMFTEERAEPEDGIWTCAVCENQLFFINNNGSIECYECETVSAVSIEQAVWKLDD